MHRVALAGAVFAILTACGSTSDQIHTYSMGERVQTGPLVYIAFDPHWYLTLGPPASPRVPANRFFVIRMNINNAGATDSAVPTLTLLDDSGEVFNELSDGTGVPDWMGIVRKIKPIDSEKGTIAFDVAPRHYKLRVADETEQIIAYIDLPLNLLSDEKTP